MVILGVGLAVPSLIGQADAATETPVPLSDAAANSSLDALAKGMAAAVDDASLRQVIHGAVKKRFDGDEEALWTSLAAVTDISAKVAGRGQSRADIADLASKMPRLQVAVPVHFESWDPATYAPLVAYFPQGVDDTRLSTITAYDAAGNAVSLNARVAPDRPVIVLGLNERTDDSGELTASSESGDIQNVGYTATPAALTAYSVDVRAVHLIDDKEPWALGDAEISMKAKSRDCKGTNYQGSNWENLNNDDDWWWPGPVRNMGTTTCSVIFYWWEDDGGAWNFELTYDKFGLGVGMDNDDDMIGGKEIPYSSFQGGGENTMRKDEWPALAQWTE